MSDKRLCYVPGCKKSTSKNISMHKMPDDAETKQKWMDILHMEILLKSTLICSRHFAVTDFMNNCYNSKIRRLRKNACPSKCLPYPLPEPVKDDNDESDDLGYETIELSNDDIYKMVCNDHTYAKEFIEPVVKIKLKRRPKKRFRFCENASTRNLDNDDDVTENVDSTIQIRTDKRLRKLPLKLREPEPVKRERKLPLKLKDPETVPVRIIRVKDIKKLPSHSIDDAGSQYIKDFIDRTSTICKYYESITPNFYDDDDEPEPNVKIETVTHDAGVQCDLEMPPIQINITGTMVDDKFCITSSDLN